MMGEALQSLYQELILDHHSRPHNFGTLANASHHAHGLNPLCGDEIEVFVALEDGRIKQLSFQGHGCAISKASASMMTDVVAGHDLATAQALFSSFHRLVTGESVSEAERDALGKAAAFEGVKEFPARVKCASLAWHTLKAALNNTKDPISTE